MTGVLREACYKSVKERARSEQSLLSDFQQTDAVTVAVVRLPRDTGIDEICDEWKPALGVPEHHLKRYWQYRSGYRTNSAVDDAVKRAYDDAHIDYHYRKYVRDSDEAQNALSGIVSRLENGEDVTLVCFEECPQNCHRTILMDMIEARRSSDLERSRTITA